MGLGLALVAFLVMVVLLGFMVVQAMFAARKWRSVIKGGDHGALLQLLDMTLEDWRNSRPPKGTPPPDWRALHTAQLVAADRDRARVSLLADADVRVIEGRREEVASEYVVARRSAVRMVERLLYEVPHTHFLEVQVDVNSEYRTSDGEAKTRCLLTLRVPREVAALSDWEEGSPDELLAEWRVLDGEAGQTPDPDLDPLIAVEELEVIDEAEATLREVSG
jgi:hypothetical protein